MQFQILKELKLSQTEVEVKAGFEAPVVYSICGIDITHCITMVMNYDHKNNKLASQEEIFNNRSKTTVPMGAGPYKFVKYEHKVVYMEANEH